MVVVEKMEMVGVDKLFYQACGGAGCYKHGDRPYHKHYSDTGSEAQAFAEHAYSYYEGRHWLECAKYSCQSRAYIVDGDYHCNKRYYGGEQCQRQHTF